MEQEIDLGEIWGIIKKRWLLLVTLPLLAALISAGISFLVLTPVYEASTTLIVGKKATNLEDQSAKLLENNVLAANRQLAKTYGEIAKSRTVGEQVITELDLDLTTEQLNSKISVNQIKDTEILEITVTDMDPELAAKIANTTVQKFDEAITEIKKVETVSVVDKAVAPIFPIKPNKKMNILIAFAVGLIGALGLALLLEYLDNTISNSKEAEELLGLSVLGVIFHYQYDEDKRGRDECVNTI